MSLGKRAKKLVLLSTIFTSMIVTKKRANGNVKKGKKAKNVKNGEKSEYPDTNLVQVPCI